MCEVFGAFDLQGRVATPPAGTQRSSRSAGELSLKKVLISDQFNK